MLQELTEDYSDKIYNKIDRLLISGNKVKEGIINNIGVTCNYIELSFNELYNKFLNIFKQNNPETYSNMMNGAIIKEWKPECVIHEMLIQIAEESAKGFEKVYNCLNSIVRNDKCSYKYMSLNIEGVYLFTAVDISYANNIICDDKYMSL